jgi:antitoxin VapB
MPKVKASPILHHRHAQLFRNGRSQALRIPKEFELPGKEVILHREGDRLIVEPVERKLNLLEVLATLKPLKDDFPDIDNGLLPLDDIQL